MKNRLLFSILGSIFLLSLVFIFVFYKISPSSPVAEIYLDGKLIEAVDLSGITEPREITITGEQGKNTVLIEQGRVCMKEASCPDKLCVNQGAINNGTYPIVCLPNKVIVKIKDKGIHDADAVSR